MTRFAAWLGVLALLATSLTGCTQNSRSPTATLPLHLVRDLRLPGDTSRFDYQDVDAGRRRLFVAHLGASRLDVIDLDRLQVGHSLTGLSAVHGVRVAPSLDRLYASATGANQLVTFDEDTLAPIARAPTAAYPDGIAVDLTQSRVFVSNEQDGSETVVDARSGTPIRTVDLGGEAANVAVDTSTDRVLVDVQTQDELDTIDPATLAITTRNHLDGCDHDHGLLVDAPARLGFVACDGNNRLLVVDLTSMHTVSTFGLGEGPDVLALDPGLGRLYVADESGTVSVFAVAGSTVHLLGQGHLAAHAHSVAVDPVSHRVFFPLQSAGGHPVLRIMAPT